MTSNSQAPVLMVQGTASHAGKSLLVGGLCRIFAEEGRAVAPFKAQNMSNNAGVTPAGDEMGRAQVAQAGAAGVEPTVDMNPVLLKPEGDRTSQVVVRGRPASRVKAGRYMEDRERLWETVTDSLDRLRAEYDLVVAEGAGSPAEINLRARDIVNMRVARYVDAPVLLVGDIERGGVFASLYGTLALLEDGDRELVRGMVINKFRGERALLEPGLEELADRTGVPVLGVVPYMEDLRVPEEDSLALDERGRAGDLDLPVRAYVRVAVVRTPRISNFDDFDPLEAEPDVGVHYVSSPGGLEAADVVILPGSKATVRDLKWMRERGLDGAIRRAATDGVPVIGICGGYQMMGERIRDPDGVESGGSVDGLGLLPAETVLRPQKETHRVRAAVDTGRGALGSAAECRISGYEIHMGRTRCSSDAAFRILERSGAPAEGSDGAIAGDRGHLVGTYLHGLFRSPAVRRAVIDYARLRPPGDGERFEGGVDRVRTTDGDPYRRVAETLRGAVDLDRVRALIRP